jgi:hypothetical protein
MQAFKSLACASALLLAGHAKIDGKWFIASRTRTE